MSEIAKPIRAGVLLAHGSRDPRWRAPFESLLAATKDADKSVPWALAYMEFAEPTLSDAVADLKRQSTSLQEVVVVPIFLAEGSHVRDDLPELVRAAGMENPELRISLQKAIGEEPEVRASIVKATYRVFQRAVCLLGIGLGFFFSGEASGGQMNCANKAEVFFNGLNSNSMDSVQRFYAQDTHFIDSVTEIRGAKAMQNYYEGLYRNVKSIRFEFDPAIERDSECVLFWRMFLKHQSLKGGQEIMVSGASHLRFNPAGQATYHRDYFDLGSMIYEQIPGLGLIIRKIKERLAKH
jgi:hypothetical protein